MGNPRLILMCGLPGAGKTTRALELAAERGAVRLTKDEWQWALGSTPWDRELGERLEARLLDLAWEILAVGRSVVVDFGLWARAERDELREAAHRRELGVELHHLHASLDELWERVVARNSLPPWDAAPISRQDLEAWHASFEAPDDEEMAQFDPPR